MTGRLIWNQDRPDIAFDTGMLYGGLHCGDCFQCFLNSRWVNVRLEYTTTWTLVCNDCKIPIRYGLLVSL